MSDLYDSGTAFPCKTFTQNGIPNGDSMGMSLRDWFAGQALAGMCANPGWCDMLSARGVAEKNALADYAHADAMLSARRASE